MATDSNPLTSLISNEPCPKRVVIPYDVPDKHVGGFGRCTNNSDFQPASPKEHPGPDGKQVHGARAGDPSQDPAQELRELGVLGVLDASSSFFFLFFRGPQTAFLFRLKPAKGGFQPRGILVSPLVCFCGNSVSSPIWTNIEQKRE